MLTLFNLTRTIQAVQSGRADAVERRRIWEAVLGDGELSGRSGGRERVGARIGKELVDRVVALLPGRRARWRRPGGFPERYLRTRTPEQCGCTSRWRRDCRGPGADRVPPLGCEQRDHTGWRATGHSFADMAGALARGDEHRYSGRVLEFAGIVVTTSVHGHLSAPLEMNASEHAVFVASVHDVMAARRRGEAVGGAARGRRKMPKVVVEARVTTTTRCHRTARCCRWWRRTFPGFCGRSAWRWRAGMQYRRGAGDTEGERRSTSSTSRATGRSWMRPNRGAEGRRCWRPMKAMRGRGGLLVALLVVSAVGRGWRVRPE